MSGAFDWWLRFLNPMLSLLVHSTVLATFSFLSVGCKTRISAIHVSSEACAVGTNTGSLGEVLEQQSFSLPWEMEASWVHKGRASLESSQNKGRLCPPLPNVCAGVCLIPLSIHQIYMSACSVLGTIPGSLNRQKRLLSCNLFPTRGRHTEIACSLGGDKNVGKNRAG